MSFSLRKFIFANLFFFMLINASALGNGTEVRDKKPFEYAADLLTEARDGNLGKVKKTLNLLEKITPPHPDKTKEATAYWINLYNGLVYWQKTADPAGLSTEMKRESFFNQPLIQLSGEKWSLKDIEKGVLMSNKPQEPLKKPQIDESSPKAHFILKKADPRIHGALNCGSRSCPLIAFYDPEHLDSQLDSAMCNLVFQSEFDPAKNELKISKIFEWYAEDFKEPSFFYWFDRCFDDKAYKNARATGKNIKITYHEWTW